MTEDEQKFWDTYALAAIPLVVETLRCAAPGARVVVSDLCGRFATEMLEERRAAQVKFSASA